MIQAQRLRNLTLDRPSAAGFKHLASASGLVAVHGRYYVIGDDELHLAMFTDDHSLPGRLIEIYPGDLPLDATARKKVKPDLEVLILLSPSAGYPHGALLALGSGSKVLRRRGALLGLNEIGDVRSVQQLDLTLFYAGMETLVPHLNIEGAVLAGDGRLLLFNRGHVGSPDNLVLECGLNELMDGGSPSIVPVARIALESIEGVPLCITDACALDNEIVFSAVAENSKNSYADGIIKSAAVGTLDANFDLQRLELLDPLIKVEGIHAVRDGSRIELIMVTDADDPSSPAGLYCCSF